MYNFISDRGCVIAAAAGCCRLALETSAGDGSTPPLSAARKEREKTHMAQWRARLAGWMSELKRRRRNATKKSQHACAFIEEREEAFKPYLDGETDVMTAIPDK